MSLLDNGDLRLELEDAHHPDRLRWRFLFSSPAAYLNLQEEYRLALWERVSSQSTGWTREVIGSAWVQYLFATESLLELHLPGLRHFQICTEDDVIDVLSDSDPAIESLGPTPPDAIPAGRSNVYHSADDPSRARAVLRRAAQSLQDMSDRRDA